MSSFVARIDSMAQLLKSWNTLLEGRSGVAFTFNEDVLNSFDQWPRIKWFYYCDDQDGNTIRLYDTEHFLRFGGAQYLENGSDNGHYERVFIRGRHLWMKDETASLIRPPSLRDRFRHNHVWELWRANVAPAPSGRINIQSGIDRELRLRYFEAAYRNNAPPVDDDPDLG